jgi:hypothetical protein
MAFSTFNSLNSLMRNKKAITTTSVSSGSSTPTYYETLFNLNSVSGLQLWLDGNDPNNTGTAPTNGSTISTWYDKSGYGRNATASVAGTYSSTYKAVTFSNSFYTTTYSAAPTNESCFIVFNVSNSNAPMVMIGANTGGREAALYNTSSFGIINSIIVWGSITGGVGTIGTTYLGEVFVSGGTNTYSTVNGAISLTGPTSVTAFTSGVTTNLGREATTGIPFYGNIMEILIYNSFLSTTDRQKVEGYLAWKWGIKANLPTSHPYYNITSYYASLFNNNSISGMQLWLDAGDPNNNSVVPTTGSTITTWYDKSGFGRNATANSAITYNTAGLAANYPALTFVATSPRWLTGNVNLTTDKLTVFAIGSMASSSGVAARIIGFSNAAGTNDFNSGSFFGLLRQSNTGVGPYRNGTYTANDPPSYSTPYLWEAWYDGTNQNATVQKGNTTSIGSNASSGNFGITFYTVAANPNTGDLHYLTGSISEIIIYNRSLSTTERQQVEGYLSWKWGLQANLPSTHPYYYTSPQFRAFYLDTSPLLTNYYRFETNDINSTSVINNATNIYDASFVNGATFSTTADTYKVGTSGLYLNSTGVVATSPYFASIPMTLGSSGITFAIWFKSNASGSWARIWETGNGTEGNTIVTTSSYNGTSRLSYEVYVNSTTTLVDSGLTVNDNTWRHFAWTINTNGTWLAYINGTLYKTDTGKNYPLSVLRNYVWLGKSAWGDAPFNGYMDDYRIYNTVLSAVDVANLYNYNGFVASTNNYYPLSPSWVTFYSNLLAYYRMDDALGATTVAEPISTYTGTVVNGVRFGSAGIVGNCATFNGTNSYIGIPYQVLNNIATGTIMAWVYPTSLTSGIICAKQHNSVNTIGVLSIGSYAATGGPYTAGTAGYVYWHASNSQSVAASSSGVAISVNAWTHIAVTFSASYVNIYINGGLVSTTATNGSLPNLTSSTSTTIGILYDGGTNPGPFAGKIDEFSVWTTALNPSQVNYIYKTQLYGLGNFYLDTTSYLLNHYRFETYDVVGTTVMNYATKKYDATLVNSPPLLSTAGGYRVGSSALSLTTASSQYVTISNTIILNATFGFSVACWFTTTALNGFQRLFDFSTNATTSGIAIYVDQGTGRLGIRIPSTSVGATLTTKVVTDSIWRHVAWVISPSGVNRVYIDGVLDTTVSSTFPSLTLISNFIGKSNQGDNLYGGKIDDFRVYNVALSAADVTELYKYTGASRTLTYYPQSPTWTPFYNNLIANYRLEDAPGSTTVAEQINAYNGTVNGTITFGSPGKIGTSALFNGSTGYIALPSIRLTATTLSFAVWALMTTIPTDIGRTFIELSNSVSDNIRLFMYASNLIGVINSSDTTLFSLSSYTNQWVHIAVVINGTTWTAYLNGVLQSTNTKTAFTLNTKTANNIGRAPTQPTNPYYSGYMDDFSIWNTALSASSVALLYRNQYLNAYNPNVYSVTRNGLVFEMTFGGNAVLTTETFGTTMTSTGAPVMVADATRGNVMYCNTVSNLQTTLTTPASFSRCFWIYTLTLGGNTLSSSDIPVWFNTNGNLSVGYNYTSGSGIALTDPVTRGTNVWTHYVITYDNASTTMRLYVNGNSAVSNTSISITGDSNALYINGGQYGRANAYYDNIRLYNRALTADEVSSMYNYEAGNSTDSVTPFNYYTPTVMSFCYSVRLVVSTYTGAVMQLRRSSDNAISDFYTDATQSYLTTAAGGTGSTFNSWIGTSTAYVAKWYDQGNLANHGINSTNTTTQPTITIVNGKYVLYFVAANSTVINITTPCKPNTVFSQFYLANTNEFHTIISTPNDYSLRFCLLNFNTPGGNNEGDWFYYSGGTKFSNVNNNTTATTVSFTNWQTFSLSTSSPTWTNPSVANMSFSTVGTSGFSASRGLTGYMTEMICHNTTMTQVEMKNYYSTSLFNSLFVTPSLNYDANVNVRGSSSLVSSWGDLTDAYPVVQSNNSYRPTLVTLNQNGLSGISYDGTAGRILITSTSPMNSITTFTLFMVLKFNTVGTENMFFSSGGAWQTGAMRLLTSTSNIRISLNNPSNANDFNTGILPAINTAFVLMVNFSSASGQARGYIRYNGTASSVNTYYTSPVTLRTDSFSFGGWDQSTGSFMNGIIYQSLLYNRDLTNTEITNIENSLYNRWSIVPTQSGTIYARYKAEDYTTSTNIWRDSTGNGRNIPSGEITSTGLALFGTTANTNGATNSFVTLQGTSSSRIQFTTANLTNYTLFTVARYTGGSRQRIFNASSGNWLSGFHGGDTGVAYHEGWITNNANRFDNKWIISSDSSALYRANEISYVNSAVGVTYLPPLSINSIASVNQPSDFQVVDVLIYSTYLSAANIRIVERYLRELYRIYHAGLLWKRFTKYHGESPTYDDTAFTSLTSTGSGTTNFTNVSTATGAVQGVNASENYSIFWYGYLLCDFTGTWTFGLSSDDGSYMWIGENARQNNYTIANCNINNGQPHGMVNVTCTVSLVSGVYYPIRIFFGEIGGADDCQFYYTRNGSANSYDFNGKFFS